MPGWINVPVKVETRERLDKVKQDKQSYDSIVNELVNLYEKENENENKKVS